MPNTSENLLNAVVSGDLKTVINLADSPNIDKSSLKDEQRNPILFLAIEGVEKKVVNAVQILEELIIVGYPIDGVNRHGDTLVHVAVRKQLADVLSLLINEGCKVNAKNRKGETPLFLAAQAHNPALFECLLNAPEIDPYIKINSSTFGGELDIAGVLRKKETRTEEVIRKSVGQMQAALQERVRRLNFKVKRINSLPVSLPSEYASTLTQLNNEERKLFVSYSWGEKTYCTVPMVDNFCSYLSDNQIYHYRDKNEQTGIAAIGGGNIEDFMREAAANANVTVAFINGDYLMSRNCLFELHQFWDSRAKTFSKNLHIIMHPEFTDVYGNATNLTQYINHWKDKRTYLDENEKQVMEVHLKADYVSEAVFLKEVYESISGMVKHLAGNIYPTYEALRTSGYLGVLKKALELPSPKEAGTLKGNVKNMTKAYEEQTQKLERELSTVRGELEQNKNKQIGVP